MRRLILTAAAAAAMTTTAMVAPGFGVVIVTEDFDPLSAAGNIQFGYDFGDTTGSAVGIGAGAGLTGDSWQTQNTTSDNGNGFSGVGSQYQNGSITGNTSTNLSDYTLSFDARSDGGSLNISLETWPDPDFGGPLTGKLNTAPDDPGFGNDQPLTSAYAHYELNLGDTNVFMSDSGIDMTGGTLQLTFQFNGSGQAPFTQTLDIDNLMLTMIPEPASLGLALLGGLGLAVGRRRAR